CPLPSALPQPRSPKVAKNQNIPQTPISPCPLWLCGSLRQAALRLRYSVIPQKYLQHMNRL
nr:hypothetical protein [Nostoc sp. CreGUA01]